MTLQLNRTHSSSAATWLESANAPGGDFPIQNLPIGVFRRTGCDEAFRGGIAIGDQIIDLAALASSTRLLDGLALQAANACARPVLNDFFAMGRPAWQALREGLFDLLDANGRTGSANQSEMIRACLVPQAISEYAVPARIGDFTDFYTSVHHAANVARLFRGSDLLPANFKSLPIAYHGRASTIGMSGQQIVRPMGQVLPQGADSPVYGRCGRLDYELELGVFIGTGNEQGTQIPLHETEDHVYGLCLLNDWSARDIQLWESQPLGPFLAKNFATTISPWVVSLEALAPFRSPAPRPAEDGVPLRYLHGAENAASGALDIQLEVRLETASMRNEGMRPHRLSRTSFQHQYWTIAQMIAHHTVGGCALRSGDLIGSGTISGPEPGEAGALVELSAGGRAPVSLWNGETRSFLEDGDAVLMTGWCQRPGFARIGFGTNRGQVVAPLPS